MAKFKAGISGNPRGRPKGTKDRRVQYRDLLEPHATNLMCKAVDLAMEGDTTALRLCLDRICPVIKAKDEPVLIDGLKGPLAEQGEQIIGAMSKGQITPSEASIAIQTLAVQARITEITDLEQRVKILEETHDAKS